jgi:hypothetical protein
MIDLKLFDITGKEIRDVIVQKYTRIDVNLTGINPGVYYIRADIKGISTIKKLIIYK